MFGINDPWIYGAYLACIVSAAICVIYGLYCWNRGEEIVKPEDITWAHHEDTAQKELD